jgi:hypothetical protein
MDLLVPITHGVEKMSVRDAMAAWVKFIDGLDLSDDPDISGDICFLTQRKKSDELACYRRVSREIIFHPNMDLLFQCLL